MRKSNEVIDHTRCRAVVNRFLNIKRALEIDAQEQSRHIEIVEHQLGVAIGALYSYVNKDNGQEARECLKYLGMNYDNKNEI